jgi:hypothetical protein
MSKQIKTIKPIKGYNQHGVKVEITNSDQYKGIYSIGMDDPDEEEKTKVKSKIGLGGLTLNEGGLLKRLKSYYIAYPDGFWIYCLLITLNKDPKFLREIEKKIHRRLAKKRYKSQYFTNQRESEWFQATIKEIRDAFVHVSNQNPNDTFIIFPSEYEEEP